MVRMGDGGVLELNLPDVAILVGIISVVGGTATGMVKVWIDRSIAPVKTKQAVMDEKLDTLQLNTTETSAAVGRVHDLEVTINNGLVDKVKHIQKQVDRLVKEQLE